MQCLRCSSEAEIYSVYCRDCSCMKAQTATDYELIEVLEEEVNRLIVENNKLRNHIKVSDKGECR